MYNTRVNPRKLRTLGEYDVGSSLEQIWSWDVDNGAGFAHVKAGDLDAQVNEGPSYAIPTLLLLSRVLFMPPWRGSSKL